MNQTYIYLVFTKTGTWLSKLIYTFSHIKYAHSSISFDNSLTHMYSFGRTNADNPFSGGFVSENLYAGVYKKYANCECLICRVKVTDEQYDALRQLVKTFLQDKEKYGYNFIGLIGVLLNTPIKRKNRYFCSQFISEILMHSKVFTNPKVPELCSMRELLTIENLEKVYEGYVNPNCLDVQHQALGHLAS
ncbi:MAG: hypothetical protein WDA14_04930 [Sphaerochaetaceae bacterium]|nr:hypothetical protein [Sphaerochaetaceae bacterium]MDD4260458.1 hypothetical protein [Sphaerochaetaceae bacterium]MDD4842598.1 hypothetical protein [Sphaerochaetaceae bacterium]MDD5076878.1 hypothetical protein [Sphaerochaetaceae bacterium]MDX9933632.1 hypothetical protein [Sphaerochaetaceae bacterium]